MWKVSFSLIARPQVDLDADGQVGLTEIPRIWAPDFKHEHLGQPGDDNVGLLKFGAMTFMQTTIEAMVYSFGNGMTTVLLCNAVLPDRVPDWLGWILCLGGNVIATIIQCVVTCNTIHLCTSHGIHFVYYGIGFLGVACYRRLPSNKWLVVLAVLWYLCLHTAMKYYVWPQYPSPLQVLPTYERLGSNYVVLSSPPDDLTRLNDKFAEQGAIATLLTSYLPFPIYELIAFYAWSALGYGYAIGLLAKWSSNYCGPGYERSQRGLLLALIYANCWVLFKIYVGLGIGDLFLALNPYYPKLASCLLCNAGALLMLIEWEPRSDTAPDDFIQREPKSAAAPEELIQLEPKSSSTLGA